MKKYLCLIYFDEAKHRALSPEAHEALTRDCLAYDEELKAAWRYITASPLKYVNTGATVRVTKGKRLITDGPFAETKEQLGGFVMIRADSFDEAIALAAKIPVGWLGCVEVRPLPEDWPPSEASLKAAQA
jgi:hypothetical protein